MVCKARASSGTAVLIAAVPLLCFYFLKLTELKEGSKQLYAQLATMHDKLDAHISAEEGKRHPLASQLATMHDKLDAHISADAMEQKPPGPSPAAGITQCGAIHDSKSCNCVGTSKYCSGHGWCGSTAKHREGGNKEYDCPSLDRDKHRSPMPPPKPHPTHPPPPTPPSLSIEHLQKPTPETMTWCQRSKYGAGTTYPMDIHTSSATDPVTKAGTNKTKKCPEPASYRVDVQAFNNASVCKVGRERWKTNPDAGHFRQRSRISVFRWRRKELRIFGWDLCE